MVTALPKGFIEKLKFISRL